MASAARPELSGPAELHYDEKEAAKYTRGSRNTKIQVQLTHRALELLNLPAGDPAFLLDVGCGSGLSGEVISDVGYTWVGLDISTAMLAEASKREVDGDLMLNDIGQGFGFRPGVFDGAISISAVQWLCYSHDADHIAKRRILAFFTSLYRCLKRGARAVLQFYPESPEQIEMLTTAATRCGFTGGVVVDYPNSTKARKHYLCLFAGLDAATSAKAAASRAADTAKNGEDAAKVFGAERRIFSKKKYKKGERAPIKSKDWVLLKKEQQRAKGRKVRRNTKYTARKRPDKF